MGFYETLCEWRGFDFDAFFNRITDGDIEAAMNRTQLRPRDFLILLSPRAAAPRHMEAMAAVARRLTVQYFGHTIQLFAPLYISNYCTNRCAYCGFHQGNSIDRRKLTLEEIDAEAATIAASGIRHILLLTGEAEKLTPLSWLVDAVTVLRRHFPSVSIEIFPLSADGYRIMVDAGVDGLTLFQESYDEKIYKEVHLAGKKRDYHWRLDAPERGGGAGFRSLTVGALLGLGEMRSEFFFTGMHARYLDLTFLDAEISVSMPRFNPAECGDFTPKYPVDDRTFVQFLLACRIFMPRTGITISTRENRTMRDHLLPLGVTKVSAGVSTSVGGYSGDGDESTPQFEISDERSVAEMAAAIQRHGFQPVYKDWDQAI